MKSRKSKSVPHAARKKAFDLVMKAYRGAKDVTGGVGSLTISDIGKGAPNPVKPSLTDFRCDVEKVISKCVPDEDRLRQFCEAYITYDSEDSIEMEVHADKIMGSGRHGLEEGIGSLFIKRGINKGYFHCIRKPRGRV